MTIFRSGIRYLLPGMVLGCFSWFVCVHLADYADWGVDEASNLWLATKMVSGSPEPVGLTSSLGIPNLAGAPMLAVPLTWMPDLVWVSRGVSFFTVVGLLILASTLRKAGTTPCSSYAVLLFFPALLLASGNLWNQFLIIPLSALSLSLMLFLLRGEGSGTTRGVASAGVVLLALLKASVHLMCFVDAGVDLMMLVAVLTLRPAPLHGRNTRLCLLAVCLLMTILYLPWAIEILGWLRIRWGSGTVLSSWVGSFICVLIAVVLFRNVDVQRQVKQGIQWGENKPALEWVLVSVLVMGLVTSGAVSFLGIQAGRRLVGVRAPAGLAVLFCQGLLVLPLLLVILRCFIGRRKELTTHGLIQRMFPDQAMEGACLLVVAGMMLVGRVLLVPTMILPVGRCDLFVSLVPILLAPACLMMEVGDSVVVRQWAGGAAVLCGISMVWLGALGPTKAYAGQMPRFIPPSEMRDAVDWVAEEHRHHVGGTQVDLGYDLTAGREWVPGLTHQEGHEGWYSIGRPYDWLLLRRYGFTNANEGGPDRTTVGFYQFGYRSEGPLPSGLRVVHELPHLHIRMRENH